MRYSDINLNNRHLLVEKTMVSHIPLISRYKGCKNDITIIMASILNTNTEIGIFLMLYPDGWSNKTFLFCESEIKPNLFFCIFKAAFDRFQFTALHTLHSRVSLIWRSQFSNSNLDFGPNYEHVPSLVSLGSCFTKPEDILRSKKVCLLSSVLSMW